jgi:hypothetical protein
MRFPVVSPYIYNTYTCLYYENWRSMSSISNIVHMTDATSVRPEADLLRPAIRRAPPRAPWWLARPPPSCTAAAMAARLARRCSSSEELRRCHHRVCASIFQHDGVESRTPGAEAPIVTLATCPGPRKKKNKESTQHAATGFNASCLPGTATKP